MVVQNAGIFEMPQHFLEGGGPQLTPQCCHGSAENESNAFINTYNSGFTNNYISLKTLVQRLEYGRGLLRDFWEKEIEMIQKAMGFRLPATVHFDTMVLSDESSEKNLLIQLVDRDIISAETVIERFGEIPEIERIRIRREDSRIS